MISKSMCGIPSFDRRCRLSRDIRGLHSGEWFIRQARTQARWATLRFAAGVAMVLLLTWMGSVGR